MTRNGKIARLPLPSRQQLNLRLQNGELAQDFLSWLNRLPDYPGHPRRPLRRQADRRIQPHPLEAGRLSRQKKQQRIRQVLGVGPEYGPAAAPESLLAAVTKPH